MSTSDPESPSLAADWEQRFRAGTTRWERGMPNPAFHAWRASGALAPGRILVPGAGRSPEPALLAAAGFSVTVVDAAPSAVAFQQAALAQSGGQVFEADLLQWSPPEPFDAVYDQTCLCALPPAILPEYAARLHAWLRPGGGLFVLLMQTGKDGGPPFDCPPAAMRALFPAPRWEWPDPLPAPVPHSDGLAEIPAMLRRAA